MPQTFNTKWGELVNRVILTYPMGSPGLVLALETLCETAYREGSAAGRSSQAADVCDGLHAEPPSGLKCMSCYHVETGYREEMLIENEIAAAANREQLPDGEV